MNEQDTMDLNEDENSSASSNADEEEMMELRTKELESQLSVDKYLYDLHIELVDLYEKLADLTSLQAAFKRFHECFPLTPKLWLKWIKTEMKVATSDRDKQRILELFATAMDDYLSVSLWQEYAQYAMEVSDLENTRKVLEKALNSAGLHVKDGSLLWDFMREIELASLSVSLKDSDAWKEQVARVIEIFRRQLSVPLLGFINPHFGYMIPCLLKTTKYIIERLQGIQKKSIKSIPDLDWHTLTRQLYQGMENTYNEWKSWQETLPENFNLDTQPIEWGYQKALKVLETYQPFEEELAAANEDSETYEIFKKYIVAVKDPSTIICLYERAVAQSCLNPALWQDYCDYAFKLGDAALTVCQRSLRNCPWSEELWVSKLRILENLKREESEVMGSFEQGLASVKPSPVLQLWFAYVEFVLRNSEDREKLDKLLEQASEHVGELDATSSLDRFRARLLAKNGEVKRAVAVWNKVLGKSENKGNLTFWLEYIALLKQFGEVNQTRSLYQRALTSCKDWAYYIAEEWLLFEREQGSLASLLKCIEKCKTVVVKPQHQQEQISSQQEFSENIETVGSNRKGKKRRYEPEIKVEIKRVKKEVEKMTIEPKKPIVKDPTKTVFISNIGPKVDEKALRIMFPNAENIEVCRDRKGKSKCFGYIQFGIEEEVMTALARDREPLDGRPVFISNCKPDKNERKAVFKYSAEIEENKLFVRGLPKALSKDEVMDIFKPHGAVDVRVVLHRSGQSKGLAYVEFPDAETTKKALGATDQMVLGEHTITVAVSAPPPKKAADERFLEPTRHARSRLQVPLIPRSIQVKSNKSSSENGASKSNDDFRKMLLNK